MGNKTITNNAATFKATADETLRFKLLLCLESIKEYKIYQVFKSYFTKAYIYYISTPER